MNRQLRDLPLPLSCLRVPSSYEIDKIETELGVRQVPEGNLSGLESRPRRYFQTKSAKDKAVLFLLISLY